MSEPFLGAITIFAGNFAPRSYAFCQGQILPIAQNTALFSLLGTTYGGNGQSTFALPDLRGRVPIHQGQAPGFASYDLGESSGAESVTLISTEIPAHSHGLPASSAGRSSSGGAVLAAAATVKGGAKPFKLYGPAGSMTQLSSIAQGGLGGQPHTNIAPILALNYIIATEGIYPARN